MRTTESQANGQEALMILNISYVCFSQSCFKIKLLKVELAACENFTKIFFLISMGSSMKVQGEWVVTGLEVVGYYQNPHYHHLKKNRGLMYQMGSAVTE